MGCFFVKLGSMNKLFFLNSMVNLKIRWVSLFYGEKKIFKKKVDFVILLDLTILLIVYVGVGVPQNIVIGPFPDRELGYFPIERVRCHFISHFMEIERVRYLRFMYIYIF